MFVILLSMRRDAAAEFLSFERFSDGEPLALFSCVGVQGRANDNEANNNLTDCVAESETTSTSTTLGADQPGFGNGSLPGPGIGSHRHRIVLEHYIELGSTSGWSSRVVLAKGGAQKTRAPLGKMS
jgi:hypothetical protein